MTIVEAFSTGLPVIGSDLGGIGSIIRSGHNGLLFEPGNPAALAEAVCSLWTNSAQLEAIGHHARRDFETKYSADAAFQQLMSIYTEVLAAA